MGNSGTRQARAFPATSLATSPRRPSELVDLALRVGDCVRRVLGELKPRRLLRRVAALGVDAVTTDDPAALCARLAVAA